MHICMYVCMYVCMYEVPTKSSKNDERLGGGTYRKEDVSMKLVHTYPEVVGIVGEYVEVL